MNRVRNTNRDRGDYESKPSVNTSTVSSLTCSVMEHRRPPATEMTMDIDVVKRFLSQDVTLETEADSVDMNSVSDSCRDPARRLSSIQDEVVNNNNRETETNADPVVDDGVSSLTLESDIRFYRKAKSKSFNDVRRVPPVNLGGGSMSRNQGVLYGLEGIREELTRSPAVVASVSSSSGLMEEPSLTLTDLQSTCFHSTDLPRGGGGIDSFMDDTSVDSFIDDAIADVQAASEGHDDISADYKNGGKPHKKNFLRRILSRVESYESSDTLELISLLHESNLENESTIKRLEQELSQMTTERDAFRTNSDRVMKVMSAKQTEMEDQLQKERNGFAQMSSVHKEEIKGWMDKASLLSTKILDLEQNAKTRDADDEVRARKIINLERSMAYLFNKIDGKVSNKIMNEDDVENILCTFEGTIRKSGGEHWKKKYHDLVGENKKAQSDAKQCRATLKKLEDDIERLKEDNAEMRMRELIDENNVKMNESLIQTADAAKKSVEDNNSDKTALEEALELSSAAESEAMALLKATVDKLKADQQHDRETIVSLRMENLKLKEGVGNAKPIIRPPPPPPPSTRRSEDQTAFEARLEKLERANKDLKDINAALTTKLTVEAEKTKELRRENEGLETKICKLVAFIKKQAKC